MSLFDWSLKQDCKMIQKCVNRINLDKSDLKKFKASKSMTYKFIRTKVHRVVFKINVKVVKLNVPTAAKTYTKKIYCT